MLLCCRQLRVALKRNYRKQGQWTVNAVQHTCGESRTTKQSVQLALLFTGMFIIRLDFIYMYCWVTLSLSLSDSFKCSSDVYQTHMILSMKVQTPICCGQIIFP